MFRRHPRCCGRRYRRTPGAGSPRPMPACWPRGARLVLPQPRRSPMLTTMLPGEDQITTTHRAKLAFIYVRQSSVGQVRQHQESTELQYRLVDRALLLGWPRERIQVIDEDLGCSGATSDSRHGFQRLIADIGLGHAGLVLSLDASRLARNNRDWYQLVELCALFGVLIADGERSAC